MCMGCSIPMRNALHHLFSLIHSVGATAQVLLSDLNGNGPRSRERALATVQDVIVEIYSRIQ